MLTKAARLQNWFSGKYAADDFRENWQMSDKFDRMKHSSMAFVVKSALTLAYQQCCFRAWIFQ
jgi:hypothetical protein